MKTKNKQLQEKLDDVRITLTPEKNEYLESGLEKLMAHYQKYRHEETGEVTDHLAIIMARENYKKRVREEVPELKSVIWFYHLPEQGIIIHNNKTENYELSKYQRELHQKINKRETTIFNC